MLGGLGIHLVDGVGLPLGIADAMEAPSLDDLTDPMQRMFRAFAEQNESDLRALAACIRGSRQTLARDEVGRIALPALVAVGTKDRIAGSAAELAALDARTRARSTSPAATTSSRSATRSSRQAVLEFLTRGLSGRCH